MKRIKAKYISKIVFILLVIIPVILGLLYAVLYSFGIIGVLNKGFTINAWQQVFLSASFWSSLGFSLYVSLVSVFIALTISIGIAINWRKSLKSGMLASIIYLPLCFPATVMAFFSFQMLSRSGFLSRIGYKIGWIEDLKLFPEWINDAYGIGIIFTSVLLMTPFFIILFSNLYASENIASYVQLSRSFGASKIQTLFKIELPILLKKASSTIYLFVIFAMGSYEVPLLLGRQNPQMISVAIIRKIQRFNLYDIPQGYAMSVLYVLLIIITLLFIYFKNIRFFKLEERNG